MTKGKEFKVYINQMHCQACTILMTNNIRKADNVQNVKISLADKSATITYNPAKPKPNLADINKIINKMGYTATFKKNEEFFWDNQTILQAVLILFFIIILYLIFRLYPIFPSLSIDEKSSFVSYFIFGFIASLSTCAALVGGFMLALGQKWKQNNSATATFAHHFTPYILFNTGRIAAFFLLGGFLGFVGAYISISPVITAFLVTAVSVLMIIVGLQQLSIPAISRIKISLPDNILARISNADNFTGKYMPLAAGSATFFLPCGFTVIAQTLALASARPIAAAVNLGFFALGTLPVLLLLGFTSVKLSVNMKFSKIFNLFVGMLIILFGLYNLNTQLTFFGLPHLASTTDKRKMSQIPVENKYVFDSQNLGTEIYNTADSQPYQQVNIKAEGFSYYPEKIYMKSDVLAKLKIINTDVIGCAQAMYLKGLYKDIVLLNKPEINIEFTPKKGIYQISCSMGMVAPIQVVVE